MRLTFLGATGTVTGSKYLLEFDDKKIFVDCGLFQGRKELRLLNWEKFPVDPSEINAVILTHAHLDHSGYLPLLVKNGFNGKIYSTDATRDLSAILLPDSGYLQEEAARFANKYGFSKHKPALPLYTKEDAEKSLEYFVPLDFGQQYKLFNNFSFQFNRAGHILGAASVVIKHNDLTVVFSGDLGRFNDPIMESPVALQHADYLIVEATYGNRLHEGEIAVDQLAAVINRTITRGGTVIIPSFAVGRAQLILYFLHELLQTKRIPNVPIFLDSPMAIDATEIFLHYSSEHKLTPAQTKAVCTTAKYVKTVEESKAIDQIAVPKIIISASGMAEGGRVLHHIKYFAEDPRNTICFTGYQAEGTRGDTLVRQHKTQVKLLGELIDIKAEVASLRNISGHADYQEIISWLKNLTKPPRKIFITHAEKESAFAMQRRIIETFHWNCIVPNYFHTEELL